MKITYTGKHANVSVRLPSGRRVTAARGETLTVSDSEGQALSELPGWGSPIQITSNPEDD